MFKQIITHPMETLTRYKKQYSYLELKSHIECVFSLQYKTILITKIDRYLVVTRVNHLTTKLWINHINELILKLSKPEYDLIKRISWIHTQKTYRRELEIELLNKLIKYEKI